MLIVVLRSETKLKLKLVHNNISLRLDCVKTKKWSFSYPFQRCSQRL